MSEAVISMIVHVVSVERLSFTCTGCGKTWSADYDVQHVADGYGHDRDYHFYDGLPRRDPTAPDAVICPDCGHGRIAVSIAARRASPTMTDTRAGDRGTRSGADKTAERAAAPLLPSAAREAA